MTTPDLSKAYWLLAAIAARGGNCAPAQLEVLTSSSGSANAGLSQSFEGFASALAAVESSLQSGHDDDLVGALVHLRMHAMGASTEFDNLVDAISDLFQHKSIRSPIDPP